MVYCDYFAKAIFGFAMAVAFRGLADGIAAVIEELPIVIKTLGLSKHAAHANDGNGRKSAFRWLVGRCQFFASVVMNLDVSRIAWISCRFHTILDPKLFFNRLTR